ncbi:hypothetical protein [Blastococcus sp. TF02A-30]|uniref:hypothetical protein n=1 Tax=Blastococcus sp. TF02A-30 TaxID=2250580 RepID=UPI000DE9C9BA|nr:hypothetical protein [Blastococcus sp. TF02A-30]
MNPLRWEVLALGFVLSLPVLALGMRGDLSADEVTTRLPWCLLAAWVAVVLVRAAATPPAPAKGSAKGSAKKPVGLAAEPREEPPAA